MPDRSKPRETIAGAWQALQTAVGNGTHAILMGDLNAEAIERRYERQGGSPGHTERCLHNFVQAAGMMLCGDGTPTWRGRTEIDHIVGGLGIAHNIKAVQVMQYGLRGLADHAVVTAELVTLHDRTGCTDPRPRGDAGPYSSCI